MIHKLMYFYCDDCGAEDTFFNISAARASGWAVARDRFHCYCWNCAPLRRNVGLSFNKRRRSGLLLSGSERLKPLPEANGNSRLLPLSTVNEEVLS